MSISRFCYLLNSKAVQLTRSRTKISQCSNSSQVQPRFLSTKYFSGETPVAAEGTSRNLKLSDPTLFSSVALVAGRSDNPLIPAV